MLILCRQPGEQILVPGLGVAIKVVAVRGKTIRLGIAAPADVRVSRASWARPGADRLPFRPPRPPSAGRGGRPTRGLPCRLADSPAPAPASPSCPSSPARCPPAWPAGCSWTLTTPATANGPDTGMSGITLTLSGSGLNTPLTTTTDGQGNYTFSNLAAGTYTLTETQPASPANQSGKVTAGSPANGTVSGNVVSNIVLGASTAATGYTFAEVPLVSTGGAVFEDTNGNGVKDGTEPGIPGVTVTLSGASVIGGDITPKTATTDNNGNYTFTGLTPGTYTIVETQPAGYSDGKEQNGTPAAASVADNRFTGIDLTKSAAASTGFNFGEVKGGTLSGVVFRDLNNDGTQAATGEPGIAGVTVRLTGTDDQGKPVNQTTTTGADGSYTVRQAAAGTYTVHEVQPTGLRWTARKRPGRSTAPRRPTTRSSGITFTPRPPADRLPVRRAAAGRPGPGPGPGSTAIGPGGTVTITYRLRNKGTATATAAECARQLRRADVRVGLDPDGVQRDDQDVDGRRPGGRGHPDDPPDVPGDRGRHVTPRRPRRPRRLAS